MFVYHPEKGVLEERIFEPGISNWDYTEVISGLKLDEQVVTNVDQPGLEVEEGNYLVGVEGRELTARERLEHGADDIPDDPIEQAPPPPGSYAITDGAQTGLLDTASRGGHAAYEGYFSDQRERIQVAMGRHGVPLLQLSTGENVVSAVQRLFGRQAAARPGEGMAA